MSSKMWHPRPRFKGMTSWFDHDFIAENHETDPEHALDCEEQDGTYVVKTDLTDR